MSLLLYLDAAWPRDWDAETLFLDDATDCGIVVRPRRYRAVLMDQVRPGFRGIHSEGIICQTQGLDYEP